MWIPNCLKNSNRKVNWSKPLRWGFPTLIFVICSRSLPGNLLLQAWRNRTRSERCHESGLKPEGVCLRGFSGNNIERPNWTFSRTEQDEKQKFHSFETLISGFSISNFNYRRFEITIPSILTNKEHFILGWFPASNIIKAAHPFN